RALGGLDLSKLSERSGLPILSQFQRRFLNRQMSKELDPNQQKTLEGQPPSGVPSKATQRSAKSES
ncbi:unnamed protein product, partial [Oppiella nova]